MDGVPGPEVENNDTIKLLRFKIGELKNVIVNQEDELARQHGSVVELELELEQQIKNLQSKLQTTIEQAQKTEGKLNAQACAEESRFREKGRWMYYRILTLSRENVSLEKIIRDLEQKQTIQKQFEDQLAVQVQTLERIREQLKLDLARAVSANELLSRKIQSLIRELHNVTNSRDECRTAYQDLRDEICFQRRLGRAADGAFVSLKPDDTPPLAILSPPPDAFTPLQPLSADSACDSGPPLVTLKDEIDAAELLGSDFEVLGDGDVGQASPSSLQKNWEDVRLNLQLDCYPLDMSVNFLEHNAPGVMNESVAGAEEALSMLTEACQQNGGEAGCESGFIGAQAGQKAKEDIEALEATGKSKDGEVRPQSPLVYGDFVHSTLAKSPSGDRGVEGELSSLGRSTKVNDGNPNQSSLSQVSIRRSQRVKRSYISNKKSEQKEPKSRQNNRRPSGKARKPSVVSNQKPLGANLRSRSANVKLKARIRTSYRQRFSSWGVNIHDRLQFPTQNGRLHFCRYGVDLSSDAVLEDATWSGVERKVADMLSHIPSSQDERGIQVETDVIQGLCKLVQAMSEGEDGGTKSQYERLNARAYDMLGKVKVSEDEKNVYLFMFSSALNISKHADETQFEQRARNEYDNDYQLDDCMCWHSVLSNLCPDWNGLEFLIFVYLLRSQNRLEKFPAPIRPAVIQLLLCRLNNMEFICERREWLANLVTRSLPEHGAVLGRTTPLNLIQAWLRGDIEPSVVQRRLGYDSSHPEIMQQSSRGQARGRKRKCAPRSKNPLSKRQHS